MKQHPELKQETYFVEGKGWRTHHVISQTSSIELPATDEEIEKANLASDGKDQPEPKAKPKKKA